MPAPTVADLIDFAAAHEGWPRGRLEEAIRTRFGVSPARYYQLLHRAAGTRDAAEHDPTTTRRILTRMGAHLKHRQERTPWPNSSN